MGMNRVCDKLVPRDHSSLAFLSFFSPRTPQAAFADQYATRPEPPVSKVVVVRETDERGRALWFPDVPASSYAVRVNQPGFRPAASTTLNIFLGTPSPQTLLTVVSPVDLSHGEAPMLVS